MKITFICPPVNFSGGLRVIAIYAEQLQKRGHEVSVVAVRPKPATIRQQLRSILQGHGWIQTPKQRPSHFDNTTVSFRTVDHAGPIVDADVPDGDVAIATWWETADWVANLSEAKGAKAYFMQDYGSPGQELHNIIPTWSLPLKIITIAQWMADLIQEHVGPRQVTIVPNSVDFAKFSAPPRGKRPQPTVGLVYRAIPSKGMDIARRAVDIARETLPDLKLIAFGRAQPSEETIPLPADIEFHCRPTDPEICQLYASCDAWLFPSRQEGFGLPILEAMASRTPVIGTSAGAAPELITESTGVLLDSEDPRDMAAAIVQLCTLSDSEWRALSENAYAKATSYSWEDATQRFEEALQQFSAEA